MSVDLIKAFDRIAASGESNGSESAGRASEFPSVLESSIERAGDGSDESNSAREESGNASSSNANPQDSAPKEQESKDESRVADAAKESEAASEAAAESGAPATQATAIAERARAEAKAEADAEAAGRLTDLDQAFAGASDGRQEEGVEELGQEEALEGERAREVMARLEAEGQLPLANEANQATADASATGAAAGALPQQVVSSNDTNRDPATDGRGAGDVGAVESAEEAIAASDASARQDAENDARGDAQRPSDESLYERAAEGSQQAAVDANVRQAIANEEAAQRAPDVAAVDGAAAVASPVAGTITETTRTATPGSPQPAPASDAIAVQTEWLATRGGGVARLVLHPPELGEIAIRVSLRGGAVDVVMVAQEAIAQGVAEEQSERLAQAFSNRDLRLENFEVRRGDGQELDGGQNEQFAEQQAEREAREEANGSRRPGSGSQAMGENNAPIPMPRILTTAPETGVDLRI